jgi:hypothetical protein
MGLGFERAMQPYFEVLGWLAVEERAEPSPEARHVLEILRG